MSFSRDLVFMKMAKGIATLLLVVMWFIETCHTAKHTLELDCSILCSTCKDVLPKSCPHGTSFVIDGNYCGCCDACVHQSDLGEACGMHIFSTVPGERTSNSTYLRAVKHQCSHGLRCTMGTCVSTEHEGPCQHFFTGISYFSKCDRSSNFLPVQCSNRNCWCVDQLTGAALPNTKVQIPMGYNSTTSCDQLIFAKKREPAKVLNMLQYNAASEMDTLKTDKSNLNQTFKEPNQSRHALPLLIRLEQMLMYDRNEASNDIHSSLTDGYNRVTGKQLEWQLQESPKRNKQSIVWNHISSQEDTEMDDGNMVETDMEEYLGNSSHDSAPNEETQKVQTPQLGHKGQTSGNKTLNQNKLSDKLHNNEK